jgi:hypothetical protein
MEALIMTSIKRRISAFVAAFALMGAVTVPVTAKYVTNETAITASAASEESEVFRCERYHLTEPPIRLDVKANTKFKAEPNESSENVASVKKATTGKKVYFTECYISVEGIIWLYSKYDKGWVNIDDVILEPMESLVLHLPEAIRADVKDNTKFKADSFDSSKTVASVKKGTTGKKVYLTMCALTNEGAWYYSQYDNGWVKREQLIMYRP